MATIAFHAAATCCQITCYSGPRAQALYDSRDRCIFLRLLDALCEPRHWHCHAWCLMPGHYQLLLEVPGNLPSPGIRRLNSAYHDYLQQRYPRISCDASCHYQDYRLVPPTRLLDAARRIVLTPVASQHAGAAIEWPWSSYRSMVGCPTQLQSMQTDMLLGLFSRRRHLAVRAWKTFVAQGIATPQHLRQTAKKTRPTNITLVL